MSFTLASPDGRLLASESLHENKDVHMIHVWEAMTGNLLYHYEDSYHDYPNSYVMAWSPDGRLLASSGRDNTVQVRDAANGKTLFTYHGHITQINSIAWSPDGKYIASAAHEVRIWQVP